MVTMQSGRTQDENSNVDAILLQIEPSIVALTRRIAYADLSDWDRDEIVQLVRIKLLPVLTDGRIVNLPAYLNITVRHEITSYLRGRKMFLPLFLDEDEEICCTPLPGIIGLGMDDPQIAIEQEEAFLERLDCVVEAVLTLPAMQRRAVICSLQERVDDLSLLQAAFLRYHIDISTNTWPDDMCAKQKLQASRSVGRRTLARKLNVDLSLYEKPRKAIRERVHKRKAKESEESLSLAV
jgi:DNA-directed RNA polymerase specialized sigma24 family protein